VYQGIIQTRGQFKNRFLSKRVTISSTFQSIRNCCCSVGVRNYIASMATAGSTKFADPRDKTTYPYSKDE